MAMTTNETAQPSHSGSGIKLLLAWLAVGIPLLWGVVETLRKAMLLFH